MYSIGPTVYNYGHNGNFRTFVAVYILRRFYRQSGYKLRHAMNITDVDDKIIRNSAHEGVSVKQYTAKYEKAFLEDSATLNIEHPFSPALRTTFCRWQSSSPSWSKKGSPIARKTDRITSASPSF